jgi:hypothetical protein
MNKIGKLFAMLALVTILLVTSGCAAPKSAGVTDQLVATTTENVLKSIDANDYQAFTQDFSNQMKNAFTEDQFIKLRDMLQTASGTYVSIGTPSLTNNQGYAVYRFPCKYKNETVFVTITFLIGGDKVEGLFFDSVNLRKAPK